ncbi:hypothetical protein Tco_1547265 [Tanacetum coccineum]
MFRCCYQRWSQAFIRISRLSCEQTATWERTIRQTPRTLIMILDDDLLKMSVWDHWFDDCGLKDVLPCQLKVEVGATRHVLCKLESNGIANGVVQTSYKVNMSDEGYRSCPLCAEEMLLTEQQLKHCDICYEELTFTCVATPTIIDTRNGWYYAAYGQCCNHMMADIVGVNSNDSAPAYQRQKK